MLLIPTLALTSFAQTTAPSGPEGGFDGHGFRLISSEADPRDPLSIYRPGAMSSLGWSAGAVADYASRPVVFEDAEGVRTNALSNVVALNLAGGFVPVAPLRIGLSMPVFLASSSQMDSRGWRFDNSADEAGGFASGDLRASVLGAVKQPTEASGFGVGLLAALDLPTGTPDRWLGTRGPAGLLGVTGTYEQDALTVSWQVDARLAPNTAPDERPALTKGGDTLDAAGGLGWLVSEDLGVGLEAHVAVPMSSTVQEAIGVPAEALLSGRYRSKGGGYGTAGLGVGLGQGAGASPIRLVVGGGFGTGSSSSSSSGSPGRSPKDADADGIGDKVDTCADQPETTNGFKDEDGCPDTLPTLTFVAKLDGAEQAEATLAVTGPAGTTEGKGTVTASGLPGQKVTATARLGACRRASMDTMIPQTSDSVTVDLPLVRENGTVSVNVTDSAGRPLEGVQVRYVIADEACRPTDTSVRAGRGSHTVGAGPIRVFVTALGYDVFQEQFELEPGQQKALAVKLKPTGVTLADGRIKTNQPIGFTGETATLDAKAPAILDQVASVILSSENLGIVEIRGFATGSQAKKVALERANAVKAELVALGVAPEQLKTTGVGPLPRGQTEVVQLVVATP